MDSSRARQTIYTSVQCRVQNVSVGVDTSVSLSGSIFHKSWELLNFIRNRLGMVLATLKLEFVYETHVLLAQEVA